MTKPIENLILTAQICVPLPLEGLLSYAINPRVEQLNRGDLVEVSVGNKTHIGVVFDLAKTEYDARKLKPIKAKLNAPPLPETLLKFIQWVSEYTLAPIGMVFRMALGSKEALEKKRPLIAYRLSDVKPLKESPARTKILSLGRDGVARSKKRWQEEGEVSAAVIKGLIECGSLVEVWLSPGNFFKSPIHDYETPVLNASQQEALEHYFSAIKEGKKRFLLDGVTGSGKTEVYFEALANNFKAGKQGLVLLPEIALTREFLERFMLRFGVEPAIWHSDLSPKKRTQIWRAVHREEIQCVIGARSALFLPFDNLGLIVVDEEHEQAYKQEERVSYHGRDMAVLLAHLHQANIILASATPSLESYVNAQKGKYQHLKLPDRFGSGALPAIDIIDLKNDPPEQGCWISPPAKKEIEDILAKNEQALLFLNRRGYAPLTLCRSCGHRFQCHDCSAWLVEHRYKNQLICHHCAHSERRPDICPNCQSEESLVAIGPGVERIREEVSTYFPDARIALLSSDIEGGWGVLKARLAAIANNEVDIIIGTQLIAKGHNFPNLMLSIILDADIGLAQGDLRGAERSWQILQQVVGRSGRFAKGAKAMIQTHMPDHPVLYALKTQDANLFYQSESNARESAHMPPFGRLVSLIISGVDREMVSQYAVRLTRLAPLQDNIQILGPADPVFTQLRGRYRQRILLKCPQEILPQNYIKAWLSQAPKLTHQMRIQVDIDPQSFF